LVTDSRTPDGRILIDVLGYQRWVEGQLPAQMDLALKRKKELENSGIEP
jgi:predicted RNA-binding protein